MKQRRWQLSARGPDSEPRILRRGWEARGSGRADALRASGGVAISGTPAASGGAVSQGAGSALKTTAPLTPL